MDFLDAATVVLMELGGVMFVFCCVVAAAVVALAIPSMLIRWAVRQLRAKCFDSYHEVRKMREAA
jgi:hypothetical protein